MKIIDSLLKSLARTVILRWQAGVTTAFYGVPVEVMTSAATSIERNPDTSSVQ